MIVTVMNEDERPAVVLWTVASALGMTEEMKAWNVGDFVELETRRRHRTSVEQSCVARGFEVVAEPVSRTFTEGRFTWLETTWPVRRKET